MANFFDQLDTRTTKAQFNEPPPAASDQWSQFPDAPKAMGPADPWAQFPDAPKQPAAADPWSQFPDAGGAPAAAPEPSSTLGDVTKSFGSGLVRGTAETAMLPVTAKRLADSGANWLFDKGEGLVRSVFGMDDPSAETLAARDQARGVIGAMDAPIYAGQDAIRGGMDKVLHKPETMAGKFANTIGEFAAPGGLPSKAVRTAPTAARAIGRYAGDAIGNVVAPAVLSEGAGQLTEGTAAEPYARIVGALFGNGATAVARGFNAPDAIVRRAAGKLDDAQWAEAQRLQNNATGIRLTGPEAIAQATGGASALPNLQRVIEGSTEGRAATAPFFAARPAQVDTAVGRVLDNISPQDAMPTTLGVRASEAANEVIDQTRQGINAQTRPLYQAAEPHTIPPNDFAPIAADPRFKAALARLRGNAELAPDYAGMPDNSVAVVDAVTKDMAARGEALRNTANPLYGPELAGKSARGASDARDIARDPSRGGSADYDAALAEQERLRRTVLQPMTDGPTGRVAAATDTAGAGNAILPQNPLTGSANELSDTVAALFGQDPQTTAALIRQNLGDRFSKAGTETMEGNREFAGAKFHKDVAGNPTREEVLDAVLSKLPGAPNVDMAELLDVLQATGRRKQIGSATAFNEGIKDEMSRGGVLAAGTAAVKTLGLNVLTRLNDAAKRGAQNRSMSALAHMFTDPRSVELIRDTTMRGMPIDFAEALARSTAQTLPIVGRAAER